MICIKRAPRARRAPGSCLRRAAARAAQLRSAASAGQSVVHRRTGPVLRCARPHPPTASHVRNADTRLGQPSPCPSFWRISAPAVSPRQGPCPPPELSLGARSSSPLRLATQAHRSLLHIRPSDFELQRSVVVDKAAGRCVCVVRCTAMTRNPPCAGNFDRFISRRRFEMARPVAPSFSFLATRPPQLPASYFLLPARQYSHHGNDGIGRL